MECNFWGLRKFFVKFKVITSKIWDSFAIKDAIHFDLFPCCTRDSAVGHINDSDHDQSCSR